MASVSHYVAVSGYLDTGYCAVFGLDPEEEETLFTPELDSTPMTVINKLCQLGYKVVSSCFNGEKIVWTLLKEGEQVSC